MTPAYIALGSNLASPHQQLTRAVAALQTLVDTQLLRTSSVYRSPAVGPGTQPDYLNAVVLLTTRLAPKALLDAMHEIELAQGRVRDLHWGPRTLDLDLLVFGNQRSQSEALTLPHPGIAERGFVLVPLADIAPTMRVPGLGTVEQLLRQLPETGIAGKVDA